MPTQPFSIHERPFAVDPITKLMIMPDGIFDTSLGEQLVGVYYTTQLFDPAAWGVDFDVKQICFTFEVPSESGIVIPTIGGPIPWSLMPQQHLFSSTRRPGQQLLKFFRADFSEAVPGKHRIRFRTTLISVGPQPGIVQFPSLDIYQHVFVTRTCVNRQNGTIDVTCPEGTLSLRFNRMHVFPYLPAHHDIAKWWDLCVKRPHDPIEGIWGGTGSLVHPPLMLPKDFTASFTPREPFRGTYGDLPFSDPLWKVLVAIGVALVCTGVSIYLGASAAVSIQPNDGDAMRESWQTVCDPGGYDPQGGTSAANCGPVMSFQYESGFSTTERVLTGLGAAAGSVAAGLAAKAASCWAYGLTFLGMSDVIDPFRAGETQTPPATGEMTLKEVSRVQFEYVGNPIPGRPFTIRNHWSFERHTNTGRVYRYEDTWNLANRVIVPSVIINKGTFTVGDVYDDAVEVTIAFRDEEGNTVKGNQVYGVVLIGAPGGDIFPENIQDEEGTGTYTLRFTIGELIARRRDNRFDLTKAGLVPNESPIGAWGAQGTWYLCCIAQSVNHARNPQEFGEEVGGKVLTSLLDASLWTDCKIKLNAHASFKVEYVIA